MTGPFDGQTLLLAGARASVAPARLPDLLDAAADHLDREAYRRSYERVATVDADAPGVAVATDLFLVPRGHWAEAGEACSLSDRETDAVRRVHATALRRAGRALDREEEFETALEVREAVVVAR